MIFKLVQGLTGIFVIIVLMTWLVKDIHRSIQPDKSLRIKTKLDALIATYMQRDTFDSSSTITFLMEVDALEDPFVEAPMLPPRSRRMRLRAQGPSANSVVGIESVGPWTIVDAQGGNVDDRFKAMSYDNKQDAIEDAYELQKRSGKSWVIRDALGRRLTVSPPPQMLKGEYKQCRDAKGRFTKKREVYSIHPLDEPYPVEMMPPPPFETESVG